MRLPATHRSHTLYRLFGSDDRLLYVGIACDPGRRFEQHRHDKLWWPSVLFIGLEHFPTREAAMAAELGAIRTESPIYNVVGSMNRPPVEKRRSPTFQTRRASTFLAERTEPLTVEEFAKYLKVHPATVHRWADRGLLTVTPGRPKQLILVSEVQRFLAETMTPHVAFDVSDR